MSSAVTRLLGAAHPGPALAVTLLAGGYGASLGAAPGRLTLLVAAVLAGQLSIGWANDLLDAERDRAVGRTDKPVATGAVPPTTVRLACGVALVAAVALSLLLGPTAAALHLLLVVGGGWAYDLGLKATAWSWLPYAAAFGALPAAVSTGVERGWPPASVVVAGALLGVGAHALNALPDLADDEATGVRGAPHRLGERWSRVLAVLALGGATAALLVVVDAPVVLVAVLVLAVAALGGLALVGRGRAPFRAAVGIALVDVALLVAVGRVG